MIKQILHIIFCLSAGLTIAQLQVENVLSGGNDDIFTSKKTTFNSYDSCFYTIGQFVSSFEVGGTTINSNYDRGIYLLKTNLNNQFIWLKKIADNDYQTEIKPNVAIHHDTNGRLVCALRFYEKLYFFNDSSIMDLSTNYYGAHLFQLDTSAAQIWNKRVYASDIGDYGVHVDKSNNILLTGMMNDDFFLTKYSNIGDSLWTITGGGSQMDWGEGVAVDLNDNIYCIGRVICGSSVTFDTENPTFPFVGTRYGSFLAKYDESGSLLWIRFMHPNTSGHFGVLTALNVNSFGVIFVGGQYNSNYLSFTPNENQIGPNNPNGLYAGFLLAYDANGQQLWGMKTHDNLYSDDGIRNISTDPMGNVYITSVFANDLVLDNNDTIDGGTYNDILIEKYDINGVPYWHYHVEGNLSNFSYDFITLNESIFLVGASNNASISFNGIPYSIDFTPNLFIAKLSDLTVGIENVHQSEIFLYPNPNSGSFQMKTEQNLSGKELRIVNKLGQEVYRSLIESDGTIFIQTDLNPGVYFLHCEGVVTSLVIQ